MTYNSITHTSGIFKLIDAPIHIYSDSPDPKYSEMYQAALQQAIENGIEINNEGHVVDSALVRENGECKNDVVYPVPKGFVFKIKIIPEPGFQVLGQGYHINKTKQRQVAYLIPISEVVPVEEKKETKQAHPQEAMRIEITKILRDNITYSGQIGDYVIHGAIDELMNYFKRKSEPEAVQKVLRNKKAG